MVISFSLRVRGNYQGVTKFFVGKVFRCTGGLVETYHSFDATQIADK